MNEMKITFGGNFTKVFKKASCASKIQGFFKTSGPLIWPCATRIFDIELLISLDRSQEKKTLFINKVYFCQTFESDIISLKIMLAESENEQK